MSEIITKYHYDEPEDRLVIERVQDVAPYLDSNKRAYNDASEFGRYKGDFVKVAEIPNCVIEQWMKEGINIYDENCKDAVRKKLLSPEYRYLRTTPGKY